MYATENKKMLNMLILNILEQYSDAEHRWTQQEIGSLLKSSYDKYDDISHYRLDKMTEVEIIDEKLKPQKEIKLKKDFISQSIWQSIFICFIGHYSMDRMLKFWNRKA